MSFRVKPLTTIYRYHLPRTTPAISLPSGVSLGGERVFEFVEESAPVTCSKQTRLSAGRVSDTPYLKKN
jgi:hypothetical protein